MVALTDSRNTPEVEGKDAGHPVEAATTVFAGSLGCLNAAGNAVPGSTSTTLKAMGRAESTVDNSAGAAGDEKVVFRKGTFRFENDGSINRTHIGADCYIVDDQTVAATDGTGTRSLAGKIYNVDASGVWVTIG